MSIVDFVDQGVLGETAHNLFPVQRIVLKAAYGIPLDTHTPNVPIYMGGWRRTGKQMITEAEYLRWLFEDGRANVPAIEEGQHFDEVCLCAGRRSGKTLLGSLVLGWEVYDLLTSHENPQMDYGLARHTTICFIGTSASLDLAVLMGSQTLTNLQAVRRLDGHRAVSSRKGMSFRTQVDLEESAKWGVNADVLATVSATFRSPKPATLRGFTVKAAVLDEMAFCPDQAGTYKSLHACTATFREHRAARMFLFTSPQGKRGHFYERFRAGMGGAEGTLCLQLPTWELNPSISAADLKKQHDRDPERFQEEWGARFVGGRRA